MKKTTFLRMVYVKFPILHKIRFYLNYKKILIANKIYPFTLRKDNASAITSLTNRRNNYLTTLFNAKTITPTVNPTTLPEIDLSIVTFNSSKWIYSFFSSLTHQNYPLKKINLYIIDNSSTDDTLNLLAQSIDRYGKDFSSTTIVQQANVGFGAGHDRAIKQGKSEFMLISNIDIHFHPDSILNAIRFAQLDIQNQVASWEFRQIPYEHPKYYDPVTLETNWSSHACILIRRSAYNEVGGYDPMIFMYTEDVELSYRFRSHGYTLKYIPTATVSHFTYKHKDELKPNQLIGSTIGNLYLRTRYGTKLDIAIGALIYSALFFRPSRFNGEKKLLLRGAQNYIKNYKHFSKGKGSADSHFPFHLFDYDLRRLGAFFHCTTAEEGDPKPLVSIITRTYEGRELLLSQSICSILNQTYTSIEVVIVQDGGDSLRPIADTFQAISAGRINIRFFSIPKQGRSHAGNHGLSVSRGQYLMFLDDDDLLFADHVETLVNELEQNSAASAAYSLAMEVLTDIDDVTKEYSELLPITPKTIRQNWDYDILLDHNFIPIQSLLFRRTLFEERGGFDTSIDQLEDWNLWLRYGHSNTFSYVEKTTSLYRSPAKFSRRYARSLNLFNHYVEARNKALRDIDSMINRSYVTSSN